MNVWNILPFLRKKPQGVGFVFRVLGYQEGNEWVAHCLELDILGYGSTQELAFEQMQELVSAQISLAIERDNPDLLDTSAPSKYFEEFDRVTMNHLRARSDDPFSGGPFVRHLRGSDVGYRRHGVACNA